jgi:hypothetical protein
MGFGKLGIGAERQGTMGYGWVWQVWLGTERLFAEGSV